MPKTIPGCGADWWARKTNRYVGCTCPPARYNPRTSKPTDPACKMHGEAAIDWTLNRASLAELNGGLDVQPNILPTEA